MSDIRDDARGIVYGLYAPNAPNLIDPNSFGGAGAATAHTLRALDVPGTVRPDAIVIASPHWVSLGPFLVQASARPRCLHDFSGFPRQLYEARYEPPGDPDLARLLADEGKRRRLDVEATTEWGLDHGAWAALLHVSPSAKIPVVPLSMTALPPEDHIAWGEAIRTAAEASGRRIAFVSTGSITHRLDMIDMNGTRRWPEGERIEKEIIDLILARRYEDLARFDPDKWATVAPEGDLAPLFLMLGALGPAFKPRLVSHEQVFGSVGLAVLAFEPG